MYLLKSTPRLEEITTVKYLPAVSIIMPFTPVITSKKNLEYQLKNIMAKLEAMLATHYTSEKAIPVILKLKNLFSNLNYNSSKKSVAIFVSPVVEKAFYLEVEMEEKILIDPAFKVSDLAYFKKEKRECLLLLLGDTFSKMYLSIDKQLKLIKSNTIGDAQVNNTTEKIAGSFVDDYQKKFIIENFLYQMDRGLSIILNSYQLPVFVLGHQKLLTHFKGITKNDRNIIQFIHGNYEKATETELCFLMEHIASRWDKLKQQHLLKQVDTAKSNNKLKTDLEEILKAVRQNNGGLLIVEKKLLTHSQASKPFELFSRTDASGNEVFFMKDDLDDIIKKVLESGGDVELIDEGLLKNYGTIALIEDYH
ncbi:MAG: hypothetical protein ABI691_07765 [Ginsengibacter sp.]